MSPNPKMSKRRIAVLLRYVIVHDLQNTVILMLRYAGRLRWPNAVKAF